MKIIFGKFFKWYLLINIIKLIKIIIKVFPDPIGGVIVLYLSSL